MLFIDKRVNSTGKYNNFKHIAPKYMKKTLTDLKGEMDCSTVIVGDFNTTFSITTRMTRQKINKETAVEEKPYKREDAAYTVKSNLQKLVRSFTVCVDPGRVGEVWDAESHAFGGVYFERG